MFELEHAEKLADSIVADARSQMKRFADRDNEFELEEDGMLDERVQDSPEGRQAWCDLQLARCENIRQMLELGWRLLCLQRSARVSMSYIIDTSSMSTS